MTLRSALLRLADLPLIWRVGVRGEVDREAGWELQARRRTLQALAQPRLLKPSPRAHLALGARAAADVHD